MTTRIRESRRLINKYKDVNLVLDFYWDNHGQLINWNELVTTPRCWSNVDVHIYKYFFTENLLGKEFNFSKNQIYVNNSLISGDLLDYSIEIAEDDSTTVKCCIAVGWG